MEKKNNDDKPKIAVALEYTPGEQAPKIVWGHTGGCQNWRNHLP